MSNYAQILRRSLVVGGLLGMPSLLAYVWNMSLNHPQAPFLQTYGRQVAYFAWGTTRFFALVGVWLAFRCELVNTRSGWLRVIIYVVATCYGFMIYFTLQDWLLGRIPSMPIPGSIAAHYGGGVLACVSVLTTAWVSWPMLYVVRRRLSERALLPAEIPRPNVRFLLTWTAIAAFILVVIQLVAQHGKPLRIYIAFQSKEAALNEYIARLPLDVSEAVSIVLMMIAVSAKPKYWLWAIPLAALFRYLGQVAVILVTGWLGFPQIHGIMAGPLSESLPYFAGSVLITILVFLVARATGLTFQAAQFSQPTGRREVEAVDGEPLAEIRK